MVETICRDGTISWPSRNTPTAEVVDYVGSFGLAELPCRRSVANTMYRIFMLAKKISIALSLCAVGKIEDTQHYDGRPSPEDVSDFLVVVAPFQCIISINAWHPEATTSSPQPYICCGFESLRNKYHD